MAGTTTRPSPGSTPKGERRREAIAAAAAEVAMQDGFAGLTHRAVAARCGVPLAATTYYSPDRAALAGAALELGAALDLGRARTAGAAAGGDLAALLVDVVVGDRADEPRRLAALYERVLEVSRTPGLAATAAGWQSALLEVIGDALARRGSALPARTALALVDGSAVQALAEGRAGRASLVALVRAALQ